MKLLFRTVVFASTVLLQCHQPVVCHDEDLTVKNIKVADRTYASGTVKINAPVSVVWQILTDYSNAPRIFKNLKSCEVKLESKELHTKQIRQVVAPAPFIKFDYEVEMKETPECHLDWHRTKGSLTEFCGSWTLEKKTDDVTEATYMAYASNGLLMPGWLMVGQIHDYLPKVLTTVKNVAEESWLKHKNSNGRS